MRTGSGSPPSDGAPLHDIDALMAALELLLAATGTEVDRSTARLILARAARQEPTSASRALGRCAESLGLSLQSARTTAAEAAELVGPDHPLLGELPNRSLDGWVLLLDRRGREVLAATLDHPEGRWLSPKALAELLGAASADVPLLLWSADPAAAMATVSVGPGEKPSPLRRLAALARLEREDIKVLLVFAAGVGVLSLVTPIVVQALVNTVAFGTVVQPLFVLTLVLVAGLGFSGLLVAMQFHVMELLKRRFFVRVVGDLAYRLPRVPLAALEGRHTPEAVNRYFDVFTVHSAASKLLLDGLDLVLRTSVGLLLLAFYHPVLLAFDVVLMLALLLILFVLGRNAIPTAVVRSKKKYKVAGWLEELARHPAAFKSAGGAVLARDQADILTREYIYARMAHFTVVFRQTVGALGVQAIASGALLGAGGFLVFRGQLTLGQLVAAELIVTGVVAAFAKLGRHLETFYDVVAAADKLGELFDLPLERATGETFPEPPPPRGSHLELHHLAVAPPGRGTVLDHLELDFEPGGRVAILGDSGTGKSLLAEALAGLRPPSAGRLLLDGFFYRDLKLEALRARVAIARGAEVIHANIFDNLRMGSDGLDKPEMRRVLGALGILDEILELPASLETELYPNGAPLSEGQILTLMIARAVLRQPSLLIVDGTLDALDDGRRGKILDVLTAPEAPWTLVVTTRRPEVAARLHRVLRIESGRLRELPETQ